MSKLKFIDLSQVCKFVNEKVDISEVNIGNYISTENMVQNKGGVTSASSLPNAQSVTAYNCNDILTSNIRPYFRKIWFATKKGGCSNDVLVFRPKKDVNAKYLYYALSDNNFFNYAMVNSKGTKMPRGSKEAIMKYMIPEFPLSTQQKIADILSAYDDLIENNNRRIEILEKTAENIYKEWFVRFRFPGYDKAKFENGIPQGWEVKRIADFGLIETGKTPPTEKTENYGGNIMFIKTPDMHGQAFVVDSGEYLSDLGHSTQPKKLLPPNSICVSCIGTGGIVAINAEVAHTNQQINSIILSDLKYLEWMYFTAKSLKPIIELYGATGATMTNLSKGKFEKLKVLSPTKNLIDNYNKVTASILENIKCLMMKNKNLIKQRDLLLPRLMSGKIGEIPLSSDADIPL